MTEKRLWWKESIKEINYFFLSVIYFIPLAWAVDGLLMSGFRANRFFDVGANEIWSDCSHANGQNRFSFYVIFSWRNYKMAKSTENRKIEIK